MDKVVLSKEQLYQLIAYIEKRGFHSPMVIVEILDHFACKVEEKLMANTAFMLDEAMVAAHDDFGALGFAPIAAAYEANIKKKYKMIYREERKKVFFNPLYLLTAVVAAFLFYKGYCWAAVHNYSLLFGYNDAGVLLYLASIIFPAYFLWKFNKFRKWPNLILQTMVYRDWWVYLLVISVSCQEADELTRRGLIMLSTMGTIASFFLVVSMFTMYAAMKKGYKDSIVVFDYFKSVQAG